MRLWTQFPVGLFPWHSLNEGQGHGPEVSPGWQGWGTELAPGSAAGRAGILALPQPFTLEEALCRTEPPSLHLQNRGDDPEADRRPSQACPALVWGELLASSSASLGRRATLKRGRTHLSCSLMCPQSQVTNCHGSSTLAL